jgi:hypothetical protein
MLNLFLKGDENLLRSFFSIVPPFLRARELSERKVLALFSARLSSLFTLAKILEAFLGTSITWLFIKRYGKI